MRHSASLLLCLLVAAPGSAQTRLTVRQLESFLLTRDTQKHSDAIIARELASLQLSEQLTDASLANFASRFRIGPQSAEQLEVIAAASNFEPPPAAEVDSQPPPDSREQNRIFQSAREYASSTALRLPDFLALRSTRSYNNTPQLTGRKHKAAMWMHFVGAYRRQVSVRAGQEVSLPDASNQNSGNSHTEGLTTWGEFGPLLVTVLADAQSGSITWNRWQNDANGKRLAVFRYTVPRSASHDLIDLCCYFTFRDKPAYHGELYVDPASGTILQITLDADLPSDAPMIASRLSVQYAPVEIGGKTYICPVRGTAVSVVHDRELELLIGAGPERFVNLVSFTNYHKFVSTSRILTDK